MQLTVEMEKTLVATLKQAKEEQQSAKEKKQQALQDLSDSTQSLTKPISIDELEQSMKSINLEALCLEEIQKLIRLLSSKTKQALEIQRAKLQ